MESRKVTITATGDGYVVQRSSMERNPGMYRREDSTHPIATQEEIGPHLEWLATVPRVVPMRGRRASAGASS